MPGPAIADQSLGQPALVAGATPVRRIRVAWWTRRWAAVVAAVALPIGLVATAATSGWVGRAFPGFFLLENAVVPTVSLSGWTGERAGVPYHARVIEVDGTPVRTNGEVYARVAALPTGTAVRYTLEKAGTRFARVVPTMRFGPWDYWLTLGLFVVNGFLFLLAALAVNLLQPTTSASRTFLLFGAVTGLYPLTGAGLYEPGHPWLLELHLAIQAVMPATTVHFGLVFPVERPAVVRRPLWLGLPYVVSAALLTWTFAGFYASPPVFSGLYACYLYSALSIAAFIGLLAFSYWENRTPLVRPRLRAILPGFVLASGLSLIGFVNIARMGGDFPINLIAFTWVFFFLGVGYAIARHDLFDIDALLKQTLAYLTLTLVISSAYAVALLVLGLVLPPQAVRGSPIFNVGFVVLAAVVFSPLRGQVQHLLDRTFYRTRLDYRRTITDVSAALTSLLDLDDILARVGRTVSEGLALRSFAFVLWLDESARLWRYSAESGRMQDAPAPGLGAIREALLSAPERSGVLSASEVERSGGPTREMAALDAVLLVALHFGTGMIGAFALGSKRSGLPFNQEDADLLRTLAAQSAIAIQNALSYETLRTVNRDLEAAVRERTTELEASNTKLERAYHELQSAEAHLLQTEKMASIGQLVAGVAHEINNPVSFIVGNVAPLRERLEELRGFARQHADAELGVTVESVSRIFEIMARGAERTAGIVNDLRSFSRVGETAVRPTDLHEGIEVSLRLLRPAWADRIEIHRDYGILPPVEAVPGQLNQVFMNILANACDAIADRGNIWIHSAVAGGTITVTVRDDGAGIPADKVPRIFDPFFTTKPQGKGTGLGLAISHGIILHHGGAIRVQSVPGRGAEFTITLPVTAAESP